MRKIPFHPLILGIYPALVLLASNVSQVVFTDTLRVFYASLLIILIVFGASSLIVKDLRKAALIASFMLIFFFSYGHVYSILKGFSVGPIVIGRTLVILPVYVILFIVCTWWILTRLKNTFSATEIFNAIALFLLVIPLYTVSSYYVRSEMIRSSQQADVPAELAQRFDGEPPNIYYIILDMHARSDVLQKIYGYDNTWFTSALKAKGFYIAEESTSNYSSTLQSISSSLNMEYINYLQDEYGAASNNREPLGLLLAQNKVTEILKESGYRTGAFQSDDFYTEFRDADEYVKPTPDEVRRYQNFWSLNSFEGIFLQSTLVRTLYDLGIVSSEAAMAKTIETPYQLHRLTILNAVDHLPDFSDKKEPYFVFAHIISPHPPYVFGPNGEEIRHDQPFSLSGPARQNGGAEYMKLYIDQLHYTDQIILDMVEKILSESKTPPIIIIQGDHGPVSYFGEDEVVESNMQEQHAILNAYYFPQQKYDLLYPSISPVNSFRIVLNTFFGGEYELLPDKNYFIPHARPYDFIDVTDRVQSDPLIP
jgi:hypothetical protein